MNHQRRLLGALTFAMPATAETVQGHGKVRGTGIAHGQDVVKGRGTASGSSVSHTPHPD